MKNTPCPLSKKCGGCQLQNMDYDRQLKYKQGLVGKLLGGYGKVDRIRGMENPTHYRCKVQAAFGTTRSGKIVSGVYQSSSHRIVNVDSCMIENEKADAIICTVRSLLPSFKIRPYDEDKRTGFLRHVLVRVGQNSGEIMVVLITAGSAFPSKNDFVKALLKQHPEITTIVQNINNKHTNMVLGDIDKPMYGKGFILDTLCGCTFKISPQSFYQINPVQTEHLYNTAIELAGLTGKERVIDAYCGTGTIGIIASKKAKEVIGAELNPSAIRDARINAKQNEAENIRFVCADAGDFMNEMAEDGETADVVLMDPPRAGSSKKFLSSLLRLNPERVVYVSCNPETLARDLYFLTHHGYRVKKIKPFDLFPYTKHVETVVLMSKVNTPKG
ncbi:MAG TPA: 23S rRNA (uracil(1939)-C(5))-methyltransferase RlmD [Ruminococcaceae bacterium]|nr:23S rRNA (uracil(1939)-C(5))-methyltransferase RlmD [Oscillospiraceae bacterium]